jgi:hypothetical protein
LISNDAPYTYQQVSLLYKSFIDHVFISKDLKSHISNFTVFEDAFISDHLPVGFFLNAAGINTVMSRVKSNVIRDLRLDEGNLDAYYVNTGSILGCLWHDFCCDSLVGLYDDVKNKVDIDIYYAEIVHILYTAACKCILRVPRSALKHY